MRRLSLEAGFTLIEGMIATVIVGLGVLGLAAMQGMSLGRNMDSNELTAATNLAADMMERVQYNRKNALAYNGIDTNAAACTQNPLTQPMASGDCNQWRTLLASGYARGLGAVRGQVNVVATGPTAPTLNQNLVTVTLTWTGASSAGKIGLARSVVLSNVLAPE